VVEKGGGGRTARGNIAARQIAADDEPIKRWAEGGRGNIRPRQARAEHARGCRRVWGELDGRTFRPESDRDPAVRGAEVYNEHIRLRRTRVARLGDADTSADEHNDGQQPEEILSEHRS